MNDALGQSDIKQDAFKRVFVLGKHRSGTTWVTNILGAHPEVFTPRHELHQGQHESAFFSSLVPYCRHGRSAVDRRAIAALFEKSDFWYLLFPEFQPHLDIEELGVPEYFRAAMDEGARIRGNTCWVEKTPAHTLYLQELLQWFPDAKFVAVKRSRCDTTTSNVYKFLDPHRLRDWFKASFATEVYLKIIHRYQDRIHVICYESLVLNYESEIDSLLGYLNIDQSVVPRSNWAPDSSYENQPPKLRAMQRAIMLILKIVFYFIPASLCDYLVSLRKHNKDGVLPNWFFRVYKGGAG